MRQFLCFMKTHYKLIKIKHRKVVFETSHAKLVLLDELKDGAESSRVCHVSLFFNLFIDSAAVQVKSILAHVVC